MENIVRQNRRFSELYKTGGGNISLAQRLQASRLYKAALRDENVNSILEALQRHANEKTLSREFALTVGGLFVAEIINAIHSHGLESIEMREAIERGLKSKSHSLAAITPPHWFIGAEIDLTDTETGSRLQINGVGHRFEIKVTEKEKREQK